MEVTLALAQAGDEAAFSQIVAAYRGELTAHCYRMLGSLQDAEDVFQESMFSAWRGLAGFAGRSSLRTWLYRICTNACLRASAQRGPRVLSPDYGPARHDVYDLGEPVTDVFWLDPWPDDPAASYLRREGVELAFVAALQHLPGSQRAVLILRDVLGYSAAEVAEMLDTTTASVNSAMQRARKTLDERIPGPSQRDELSALGVEGQRELVDAFIAAWESSDVDALVSLLARDAKFTMPPLPAWFNGREDIARFFAQRVFETPWRLRPIQVNGQLAVACYQQRDGRFPLSAINVLSVRDGELTHLNSFIEPRLYRWFGLPMELS